MVIDPSIFLPYQGPAIERLVDRKRSPLLAPMGSGKTLMALAALDQAGLVNNKPIIIVAPKMAAAQWQDQIAKWLGLSGDDVQLALGDPLKRRLTWRTWTERPFTVTNYHCLLRDKEYFPKKPPAVLGDEGHKLRNRKITTYKTFNSLTRHSEYLIPMTGTWARRGPQDLWTLLNMANAKTFSSYWKFVKTWCHTDSNGFGQEILGPKNEEGFKNVLQRYCSYVSDEEVEPYLPKKHRIIVPIDMSPSEERIYRELSEDMIAFPDDENILVVPSILAKIVRLRQLLVSPKTLAPNCDYGSGLEFIASKAEDLGTKHFAIFTPFTTALPHIKAYIEQSLKVKCLTLQGGTSVAETRRIVNECKASKCPIAISIHYAESYDLETMDTGFFLGYDYSWDVNAQAEDRLRRASSDHGRCTYYYLQHRGTYEEDIMQLVDNQFRNVKRITPRMFRRKVHA